MQTLEVITIQNPDSGQDRDKKNPDRQTPDSIFPKQPDRIRTAERTEIDKIWTDRHRTGLSLNSHQKRDTDRTRTVLSTDIWWKTKKLTLI